MIKGQRFSVLPNRCLLSAPVSRPLSQAPRGWQRRVGGAGPALPAGEVEAGGVGWEVQVEVRCSASVGVGAAGGQLGVRFWEAPGAASCALFLGSAESQKSFGE